MVIEETRHIHASSVKFDMTTPANKWTSKYSYGAALELRAGT